MHNKKSLFSYKFKYFSSPRCHTRVLVVLSDYYSERSNSLWERENYRVPKARWRHKSILSVCISFSEISTTAFWCSSYYFRRKKNFIHENLSLTQTHSCHDRYCREKKRWGSVRIDWPFNSTLYTLTQSRVSSFIKSFACFL